MKPALVPLGLSLLFAFVSLTGAYEMHNTMTAKADMQEAALADFRDWKTKYTKLLPVEQKWQNSLPNIDQIKDLYSVSQLLGDTPKSDPDTLVVEKVEEFMINDIASNAAKVCLRSSDGAGLVFKADKVSTLITDLDKLVARPDILIGGLDVFVKNGKIEATAKSLCLLVRHSSDKSKGESS